jgi:hypothetical protein
VAAFDRRRRRHRRSDPFAARADRRERIFASATRRRVTWRQAPPLSPPRAWLIGPVCSIASRLAPRATPGQAGDVASVAPRRIPALLVSKVALGRSARATHRSGSRRSDRTHGGREPTLGSRAHSRRALEARRSRREANGSTLHARSPACGSAGRTELADIPPQPHSLGLRFLADLRYGSVRSSRSSSST